MTCNCDNNLKFVIVGSSCHVMSFVLRLFQWRDSECGEISN